MKRIISLLLAVMLVILAVPMAYAADTQDYSLGTAVKYTAANNENYTITVPAKLAPGAEGTVTLDGYWASNTVVSVTAEENVVLTNSINANDKKTLDVYFDGISEAGDNNGKQTFTAPVSVADIEAALFGTWNGQFNYTVGRSEGSGGSTGGDSGTTEPSDPDNEIVIQYGDYISEEGDIISFNEDGSINGDFRPSGGNQSGGYWVLDGNRVTLKTGTNPELCGNFSNNGKTFTNDNGIVFTYGKTVTIAYRKYVLEEGMTWGAWVESKWSPEEFTVTSSNTISYNGTMYVVDANSNQVTADDVIDVTIKYNTQK